MNKSLNFLYFEDYKNNSKSKVAYAPGYYWKEELDDIVIKCEIINNHVELSVVPEKWITSKEISIINNELKNGIGDAWEFIQFYKTPQLNLGDDTYFLVSNSNYDIFKSIKYNKNNYKKNNNKKIIEKNF